LPAAIGNRAMAQLARVALEDSPALTGVIDETRVGCDPGAPGEGCQEADHLRSPRFAGDETLEACYEDRARLDVGARGDSVEAVQQALIDLGYDLGPSGADRAYGPKTAAAVRAFKAREALGFEQYGDVGPGTMHRLDELFPPDEPPPCPDPDVLASSDGPSPGVQSGPLLAFALGPGFCKVKPGPAPPSPPPTQFSQIPAAVRQQMKVSAVWEKQGTMDKVYYPFTGRGHAPSDEKGPPPALPQTLVFGNGITQEKNQRDGLQRVAFSLTGSGAALPSLSTVNINLTVQAGGSTGPNLPAGVYRFSRFPDPAAPKKEMILVELIGQVAANPAAMPQATFETKYKPEGYTLTGSGWQDPNNIGMLDRVLGKIKAATRVKVKGLKFEYVAKPQGQTEDGRYDGTTKTASLYFSSTPVFDASDIRFGTEGTYGEWVAAHEIGHALQDVDPQAVQLFAAAVKTDKTAITSYGATKGAENFSEAFALYVLDPATLDAMRPTVSAFFKARY
jgi:peptidoglycan hydrolase-like protein with peptidoglycan-binding domain